MKYLNTQGPKYPKLTRTLALLGIWVLGYLGTCHAEITATVYPGYQFSPNERPTVQQLNLLGRPTILVSGTLGGTNVALAANSVTTTMMSDTLPGSNLVWDASSPRKLVIEDGGVNTNQLNADVAGLGLSGGSGTALRVNVDTNTITITNDVVTLNLTTFSNLVQTLATNIAQYVVTNWINTNRFISFLTPMASGQVINTNHGLGTTPTHFWANLTCLTNDGDYVVGDVISTQVIEGSAERSTISVTANSTNMLVGWNGVMIAPSKESGGDSGLTGVRWSVQVFAEP